MDRFDLENELTNLSKISDDIKTIASQVMDGTLDRDDVFAALHGLAILHDARYAIAWDIFLQVFKLEEYSDLNDNEENVDIMNNSESYTNYMKNVFAKYDYPDKDKSVWY
jgi:hypothetical protein